MTVTHKRPQPQASGSDRAPASEPGIRYHCDACAVDITHTVRIRCAGACEEVDLCPPCFLEGKEVGKHKAWHDYRVVEQHSYPIFTEDWGADEELLLLEAAQLYGLGNWADIADHIGSRTKEEVEAHYHQVYLSGGENCMPPMDKEFDIDQDTFHARKKARIEEMRSRPIVLPPPKQKPLTSAPTNHEIAGYMPGRLEFEHELENDAELLVKDMEFGRVYDFGGAEQPEAPPPKTPPPKEAEDGEGEKEGGEEDGSNLEEVIEDEPEGDLKLKLAVLEMYNERVDRRLLGKRLLFDRGLLEHKKIQAADRKRPRDEREHVNRLKPFARLHTASEHEAFVDGLVFEMNIRKRIAELQEYRRMGITTFAEAEKYEKDKVARSSYRPLPVRDSSVYTSDRHSTARGRDAGKRPSFGAAGGPSDDGRSREGTPKAAGRKPAAPLNLANAAGLHLLTPAEQTLCAQLRILPKPFLVIKETLVREYARRGGKLRKREAREFMKIDVNKSGRIFDFLMQAGVLRVPDAPAAAPAASNCSEAPGAGSAAVNGATASPHVCPASASQSQPPPSTNGASAQLPPPAPSTPASSI